MIETAYPPAYAGGRDGLRTLSGMEDAYLNEQAHPLPPPKAMWLTKRHQLIGQ